MSLQQKIINCVVAGTFLMQSLLPVAYVQAQNMPVLPAVGTFVPVTSAYQPPLLVGLAVDSEDPLQFEFFVDGGEEDLLAQEFEAQSMQLIKYFMAALTTPEDEMWVNLSPDEPDRIVPDAFGTTAMGRDLLAQDYMLKQLTASLMHPDFESGKEFWKKIYAQAGAQNIASDLFNKVWIVPEKAQVYVHENRVFVVDSHLKVMLEDDYKGIKGQRDRGIKDIVHNVLLPEIEREVNEGKTFAKLRQIYNALILATWYKKNLKASILGQYFVDQNKTDGLEIEQADAAQTIYDQYLQSLQQGVFNFIQEEVDHETQEVLPRKYFAGGIDYAMMNTVTQEVISAQQLPTQVQKPKRVSVGLNLNQFDAVMNAPTAYVAENVLDEEDQLHVESIMQGLPKSSVFGLIWRLSRLFWFTKQTENRRWKNFIFRYILKQKKLILALGNPMITTFLFLSERDHTQHRFDAAMETSDPWETYPNGSNQIVDPRGALGEFDWPLPEEYQALSTTAKRRFYHMSGPELYFFIRRQIQSASRAQRPIKEEMKIYTHISLEKTRRLYRFLHQSEWLDEDFELTPWVQEALVKQDRLAEFQALLQETFGSLLKKALYMAIYGEDIREDWMKTTSVFQQKLVEQGFIQQQSLPQDAAMTTPTSKQYVDQYSFLKRGRKLRNIEEIIEYYESLSKAQIPRIEKYKRKQKISLRHFVDILNVAGRLKDVNLTEARLEAGAYAYANWSKTVKRMTDMETIQDIIEEYESTYLPRMDNPTQEISLGYFILILKYANKIYPSKAKHFRFQARAYIRAQKYEDIIRREMRRIWKKRGRNGQANPLRILQREFNGELLKNPQGKPVARKILMMTLHMANDAYGAEELPAGWDAAMSSSLDKTPGGIDMNPSRLDLQEEGEAFEFQMPAKYLNIDFHRVNGFTPVIYSITPVMNLPLLLGLVDDSEEVPQVSYRSQDPLYFSEN